MSKKIVLKVVIIGDSGVGKTALMQQFVNKFYSSHYKATIGADFLSKDILLDNKLITLQIWDTAGMERFNSLGPSFWRGAEACVLVFDVTDTISFNSIDKWRKDFIETVSIQPEQLHTFPFILIGNKTDLEDKRSITQNMALKWCKSVEPEITYIEASAKNATNVDTAFLTLASEAIKKLQKDDLAQEISPFKNQVALDLNEPPPNGLCNC